VTILPLDNRKEYDIGLPVLSPTLIRKKTLADEIAGLDVMSFQTVLLPLTADDPRNKTFRYEGYDIITLQKEVGRDYTIPEPQTAQEVIGYYPRRIAEAVKLPSQFAALAPKVREFFEQKAFGKVVDLADAVVVKAMGTPVAHYVCVDVFSKAARDGRYCLICSLILSSASRESAARIARGCRSSSIFFTIAITARNINKITATDTVSSCFGIQPDGPATRVGPMRVRHNGPSVQNV
jgi:hypothetical protein